MSDPSISIRNVSKSYQIVHNSERQTTLVDALMHSLRNPLRRRQTETFYALRDIEFDVQQGEALGIIGRNGAGKSTLLKILSRITEPSTGEIDIYGRVGSLLEVGTGFHAELTGRENIYLNGAILGMKRSEIRAKFDEIVSFAEAGQFLDTPVKRYSSGMYVRLAFAVAANLSPDILIVDEVLAVGDMAFQRKCLGKMDEVAKQGRTVLFVSHNLETVSALTQKCVVLEGGKCVFHGPTADGIRRYLQSGAPKEYAYTAECAPDRPSLLGVKLHTSHPDNVQSQGEPFEVDFDISLPEPTEGIRLVVQVLNELHQPTLYAWRYDSDAPFLREPGVHRVRCRVPKMRLYVGRYSLRVHFLGSWMGPRYDIVEGICPFEVAMLDKPREGPWLPQMGVYVEDCNWDSEIVSRPRSENNGNPLDQEVGHQELLAGRSAGPIDIHPSNPDPSPKRIDL